MAQFSASAPDVLNAHLENHPYLGGDHPSDVDAKVYEQFENKVPNKILFPYLWRWHIWLSQYTSAARDAWTQEDASSEEDEDTEDVRAKAQEEIEKVSGPAQDRLNDLLKLQINHECAMKAFEKETAELERKYQKIYDGIYQERKQIVSESADINNFWLKALKSSEIIAPLITARDEQALQYLSDIRCIPDPKTENFSLEFHFSSNAFFDDKILSKSYFLKDEETVEKIMGTAISWKENLTIKPISKKQQKRKLRNPSFVIKEVKEDSFFDFFQSLNAPTEEERKVVDLTDDQDEDEIEEDFDIANEIKDSIIPEALYYYLGVQSIEMPGEQFGAFGEMPDHKVVVLARSDLNMSAGKLAAQVGHASIAAYKNCTKPNEVQLWQQWGEPIIVLKVKNAGQMQDLGTKARNTGIDVWEIRDAGRTEVDPGTVTVMAIGPAKVSVINTVTGELETY